jgi:predicted O-methyltransferase YrrM
LLLRSARSPFELLGETTMSTDLWTAVDRYLTDHLVPPDPALDHALATSATAGLPEIAVSPTHGRLLHLLAKVQGARRILEIGTLGGYSTIWLARALPPGGHLITLEFEPKHADVARATIGNAGLSRMVQVRVGAALDTLPQLAAEGRGPFDLIFIDADKVNTPAYFTWALTLSKPGSLIIVDNVVRDGAVADPSTTDPGVQGMRRFFELVQSEPRVEATAIQTVGIKGYDGLAIVRVTDGGEMTR